MDYNKFEILAAAATSFCSALASTFDATNIYTHATAVIKANAAFQELVDQRKSYQYVMSTHSFSVALHQDNIQRIRTLSNEAIALNDQLDQCMHRLLDAHKRLNETIVKDEKFTSTRTVPHTMLLNYAAKISKFSSAPNGYDPDNGLYGNTPAYFPWPPEDAMRKGVLMMPRTQTEFFGTKTSTPSTEIDQPNIPNDELPTEPIPSKKSYINVFDGLDLYEPKDSDETNMQ
ncbi:uncharacterized protein T551_01734 [Pneumocystis jirovecii RU7]|uniref:Mediator of RNA polymerase II transcription subunit 4 n=1 Tax=Pneumocystis jirovecii (strain RU7) TaxID=1408657 RepID=A0A0W4ZQ21_PNEJ7|nr:uncharacterized protein T551_01734 [Pneumocystis jirovecii RU7]KTW30451.1 hypothetical protein T551_01734 [Pneumocystis jirovecii RU7]